MTECLICAGVCPHCNGELVSINTEVPRRADVDGPQTKACVACGASFNDASPSSEGGHRHYGSRVLTELSGEFMTKQGETWYRIGKGDWIKGDPPEWLRWDDDE